MDRESDVCERSSSIAIRDTGRAKGKDLSSGPVLQDSIQAPVVRSANSWWSTTNWFRTAAVTDDVLHMPSKPLASPDPTRSAAVVGGASCFSRFQMSVPAPTTPSLVVTTTETVPKPKVEPLITEQPSTNTTVPTAPLSPATSVCAAPSTLISPTLTRSKSLTVPGTSVQLECLSHVHPATRAEIMRLIALPLLRPALHRALGVAPPSAVVLTGPAGAGKTHLARQLARQLGVHVQFLSGPHLLISKPDPNGKTLLDKAITSAFQNAPAIIVIDDVDAIAQARTEGRLESEGLIKNRSQLQDHLDALRARALQNVRTFQNAKLIAEYMAGSNSQAVSESQSPSQSDGVLPPISHLARTKSLPDNFHAQSGAHVLLLCTSSLPATSLAPQITRAGRMEYAVEIHTPDMSTRLALLKELTAPLRFASGSTSAATPTPTSISEVGDKASLLNRLAIATEGLLPADLQSLVTEAGMNAVRRTMLTALGVDLKLKNPSAHKAMDQSHKDFDDDIDDVKDSDPIAALRRPQSLDPLSVIWGKTALNSMDQSEDTGKDLDTSTIVPEACSPELLQGAFVEEDDFLHALARISRNRMTSFAGSRMGGVAGGGSSATSLSGRMNVGDAIERTLWTSIIGLNRAKSRILHVMEQPLKYPEIYQKLGMSTSTGVLLFGSPGSGKSMLARAIANRLKAAFLAVPCSELLSPYTGGSEANVRAVFAQARSMAPCVVFFDDVETLFKNRSSSRGGQGVDDALGHRILNQILTEMDVGLMNTSSVPPKAKVHSRDGNSDKKTSQFSTSKPLTPSAQPVFVLCASNNPAMIDPALLRPGRLDHAIYLPLPNADVRLELLASGLGISRRELAQARSNDPEAPIGSALCADDITLALLCEMTRERMQGWSSADVAATARAAKQSLIRRAIRKFAQASHSSDSSDTSPNELLRASDVKRAVSQGKSSVQPSDIAKLMHFKWLVQQQPPAAWKIASVGLPSQAEIKMDSSIVDDSMSAEDYFDDVYDEDSEEIDLLEQVGVPCRSGSLAFSMWAKETTTQQAPEPNSNKERDDKSTDSAAAATSDPAKLRMDIQDEVSKMLSPDETVGTVQKSPQEIVNTLLSKFGARK